MFNPKYKIIPEYMGGKLYHMIYRRVFFFWVFWERWNTQESAKIRLRELIPWTL